MGEGPLRIGVDVGGTFTDIVSIDATGRIRRAKVLTTPEEPELAMLEGIDLVSRHGRGLENTAALIHGTTLATNAIVERRGARVGVLTTKGFRDLLAIGRERRHAPHDPTAGRPEQLVPRRRRREVSERIDAAGDIVEAVNDVELALATQGFAGDGVQAIAVCLLNSHRNPVHELAVADALRRALPGIPVMCSAVVDPNAREYERFSTTVVSAYIQPLIATYLRRLGSPLGDRGYAGRLWIMSSAGGINTADQVAARPMLLLESGPAGAAVLAADIASAAGFASAVAFDMGGTTAKICVVEGGSPVLSRQTEVARLEWHLAGSGFPVRIPIVDVTEIGTGGGSIAAVNSTGSLSVGPQSAGAVPGPACYARGGLQPTVTDAALVLGYVEPSGLLGGALPLDAGAAERVLALHVANPLAIDVERAAWGVYLLAAEQMALSARQHLLQRGLDPAHLVLVAMGGAGPLFAAQIIRVLGMRGALCPFGAGVASAIGFLAARPVIETALSTKAGLGHIASAEARAEVARCEREAADQLIAMGVDPHDITFDRLLAMRYRGQGYEIEVPVGESLDPDDIAGTFQRMYTDRYATTSPSVPIEAVSWRIRGAGPKPSFTAISSEDGEWSVASVGAELTIFDPVLETRVPAAIHRREALSAGQAIAGPALLLEPESTVLVPSGFGARVLSGGVVLLEPR